MRYNLSCRSPSLVFIRGACFAALSLSAALQEHPVKASYIMSLWFRQAHIPELLLQEGRQNSKDRED